MNRLYYNWNRFWFEPATPDNLGLARIFLYGSMTLFYLLTPYLFPAWGWHSNYTAWGDVSSFFWKPIWYLRILHLPLISPHVGMFIDVIWKLTLVSSTIGLFTRFSSMLCFLLSAYLFALPNSFGATHHLDNLVIWSFFIMALSRCGDGWSIDCLIKNVRAARLGRVNTGAVSGEYTWPLSGEYTWPIRMIWVVMATIYLAAAITKLRHSGLAWVTGDTMRILLMRAQYHITDAAPLTDWGLFIARHGWMSHLLAAMGLALELFYFVALFSKPVRWIVVPSAMLMQLGVAMFMGPNFYQMIICQLLWLPLDKVVAHARPMLMRKSRQISPVAV